MRFSDKWPLKSGFASRALLVMAAAAIAFLPIVIVRAAEDPNILWKIVNGKCVVDQKSFGHPAPCARVDLGGGYAILKDIVGETQYLLIPTTRITGIESPALLQPGTPNYFAQAWSQTPLIAARLGHFLPRVDLSLAINSVHGRTQLQLHIHMDCISEATQAALMRHMNEITPAWTSFPEPLHGHPYQVMRIMGESLGATSPFQLLADGLPGASGQMGAYTLVLVGAEFPAAGPGFILLAGKADLARADFGSGEDLQDHQCALGHLP
ncbi:CDP-diacylglycerol diphosphatase [Acidisoma cellulosilytica]|uniref:CDP-diacylglycerol pyrophosphatase n=1 Tax=Acidisoma cellulosilyticum TaxID=2802395 RepID=A0A963Z2W8_9PROT|nr:CDP-diacylglycerol diphosphatase [Acidisoma cellulosilyticum]MCB8880895.1 CDP-diacylglycerol diphosphatase [Acidisoma cellulosilyticum]